MYCSLFPRHNGRPVSYTHLRAHETDSSLFRRQRQMCIRDSLVLVARYLRVPQQVQVLLQEYQHVLFLIPQAQWQTCLLYTSPSPRDGLLSISSAASDVYKRQPSPSSSVSASPSTSPSPSPGIPTCTVPYSPGTMADLSLIHISEPTRRTPLYFVGSVRCV